MTQVLRQSTAVDVLIGPFLDLTDGATAETGESPTVKLSKNGQALAAKSDVTTPVHDADGYYNCEFDATDTNTVGTLVLSVAKSANALPVRHEFQVVEEAVYDAIYAASAALAVGSVTGDVGGLTANAQTDVAAAVGLASANLDTQLLAIANYVEDIPDLRSGVILGETIAGTLSTTRASVDLDFDDGQLAGRVLIWLSGNCEGEATDITDFVAGVLTFSALTTPPGVGDTFKIV